MKYIKGFNKKYIIYKNGNVVSVGRKMWNGKRWWNSKDRELKPTIIKIGYKVIGLVKKGKCKNYYLHRLLAEHFIPNPLNKIQVNHKDGNKLNNNLSNLEWVTHKENVQHAFKNGLMKFNPKKGEEHYNSIFTNKIAKEIRELKGKEKLRIVAQKYRTKISTVWNIQNYKTYINI